MAFSKTRRRAAAPSAEASHVPSASSAGVGVIGAFFSAETARFRVCVEDAEDEDEDEDEDVSPRAKRSGARAHATSFATRATLSRRLCSFRLETSSAGAACFSVSSSESEDAYRATRSSTIRPREPSRSSSSRASSVLSASDARVVFSLQTSRSASMRLTTSSTTGQFSSPRPLASAARSRSVRAASTAWRPTPPKIDARVSIDLSTDIPCPNPGARARKSHRPSRNAGKFKVDARTMMARAPSRGSAACAASSALAKARDTALRSGGPAVSSIGRARLGSEAAKNGECFVEAGSDANSSRVRRSTARVSLSAAASASSRRRRDASNEDCLAKTVCS